MEFSFYKYQGTGNDFVIIDNRQLFFSKNETKLIQNICDRRFGIGADGLILLENDEEADFRMVYFNADGAEGSMCGNGGRCIVSFAKNLGIITDKATFMAVDGKHMATIKDNFISLKMSDVSEIKEAPSYIFINTGSPHHIEMADDLEEMNVREIGSNIRHNKYGIEGANINFVSQREGNVFAIRTYERGVENETLSCGTGVTAAALAMYRLGKTEARKITLITLGGKLSVSFEPSENGFKNIYLEGLAEKVFKGKWK